MRVFLSFILFLWWTHLCAQNLPGKTNSPQMAFMPFISVLNYASVDELYSPLVYNGCGPYGGIRITRMHGSNRHILEAGFSGFDRHSKELTVPNNYFLDEKRFLKLHNYIFELSYQYAHRLSAVSSPSFSVSIAGKLSQYAVIIDDVQVYPEISVTSLSPGFILDYSLGKSHGFSLSAYAPLVSVYLRNNYSTAYPQIYETYKQRYFLKDNLKLAGPGTARGLTAEAGYAVNLSPGIAMNAMYRFGLLYFERPRRLRIASGLYTVGFTYKL